MLLRKFLYCGGNPAIGISLAQNRVDGAAENLRIARSGVTLSVAASVLGIVRNLESLRLQFCDGFLQLRYRCTDVRQLDDVGVGRFGQFAELCECVRLALVRRQCVRKSGEDARRERDVSSFNHNTGRAGERFNDGQQ